jgi:mRNA interferase MazF
MTDFFPTVGHEQSGRRPALVVSNVSCKAVSNMTMVCPITNTNRMSPAHIEIKNAKTTGFIMCDQARSLDLTNREFDYVERLDEDTLWEAIDTIQGLIEIL